MAAEDQNTPPPHLSLNMVESRKWVNVIFRWTFPLIYTASKPLQDPSSRHTVTPTVLFVPMNNTSGKNINILEAKFRNDLLWEWI